MQIADTKDHSGLLALRRKYGPILAILMTEAACIAALLFSLMSIRAIDRGYTLSIAATPFQDKKAGVWQAWGERAGVSVERSTRYSGAFGLALTAPSGKRSNGSASVGAELGYLVGRVNKTLAGMWLSGLVAFGAFCLWSYRDAARGMAAVAPVLIGVSSLILGTPCLTCQSGVTFQLFAPAGLLILAIAIAVLQWTGGAANAVRRLTAMRWLCLSAIGTQAFLNVSEPRFCPWCLLSALSCAACAFASVPQDGSVTTFDVSRAIKAGFVPLALGIGGMHIASATGRYEPLLPSFTPEFDAAKVAYLPDFTPGVHWDASSPPVLIVTLPWCRFCKQAKSALTKAGVPFREISPCSYVERSGCFDTKGQGVHVPVVFAVDERRKASFLQVGWTSDAAVRDLKVALSSLRKASASR